MSLFVRRGWVMTQIERTQGLQGAFSGKVKWFTNNLIREFGTVSDVSQTQSDWRATLFEYIPNRTGQAALWRQARQLTLIADSLPLKTKGGICVTCESRSGSQTSVSVTASLERPSSAWSWGAGIPQVNHTLQKYIILRVFKVPHLF